MIIAKKNQSETPLYVIICLAILRTPLYNMCEAIEKRVTSLGYLINLFLIIYFFSIIISSYTIITNKYSKYRYLFCLVPLTIIFAWSVPNFGSIYLMDSLNTLIVFMIIPFIFACFINNTNQLIKYLRPTIFIIYIFGSITTYYFINSGAYYSADGMMATYSIAVPTSYYCYTLIEGKNNKLFNLILSLLGMVLMFFTGSRGGFILIIMAIFLGLLNIKSAHDFKFLFKLGIFIIMLFIIFFNQFIDIVQGTRIFDMLSGGEISESSGREWHYNKALEGIVGSPLFGCGLFGDRIITKGFYTHNLFLEILCDYGIVVGSLFIMWFIYMTFEFVINKKNKVITILFLIAIPQLLVSSSYLLSCYFWVYIGILVSKSVNANTFLSKFENHTENKTEFDSSVQIHLHQN